MIYSDVTIIVKGNTATLDNDLYLYKNDKNITINISIVNSIWNFAKKLPEIWWQLSEIIVNC